MYEANRNVPEKRPNYPLRRTVAAGLAAVALLGGAKGVEYSIDRLQGQEQSPIVEIGNENNQRYVVQPGDTVWGITQQYYADTLGDKASEVDLRPFVDDIMKNQLNGTADLMPGMVLELPPSATDKE